MDSGTYWGRGLPTSPRWRSSLVNSSRSGTRPMVNPLLRVRFTDEGQLLFTRGFSGGARVSPLRDFVQPRPSDQQLVRAEAGLVTHRGALEDPVAQIDVRDVLRAR